MSVVAFAVPAAFPLRAGLLAALACVALLSACQREVAQPEPEIRPVRSLTIEKRATGGTVQAQTEINQAFRIDGRLVEEAPLG